MHLQIAVRFYEKGNYPTDQPAKPGSRRKRKMQGYQVSKPNYHILKTLIPDQVTDIPRSRIVEYRYIQVDDAVRQQNRYFLLPITEAQLPQVESITKTEQKPTVYLWRDGAWWSFPQLETYTDGEMTTYTITRTEYGTLSNLGKTEPTQQVETRQIEKTKIRIRQSYEASKGPGFLLADAAPAEDSDTNPAGFPVQIIGNGMVLEWKRGYEDKNPCWWLRDEKRVSKAHSATYKHYATLKATYRARWSRGFAAWYFTGGESPPQSWLELVGYRNTPAMPPELSRQIEAQLERDQQAETPNERLARLRREIAAQQTQKHALAAAMKPYHEFHATRQLCQHFEESLHHLSRYPLLPALATPPLDDPWS